MSITSERSFGRLLDVGVVPVKEPASCSNRARGKVERSSSSTSISLEDIEKSEPAEDLRRRFVRLVDCAHSGTGFNTSNCLRKRLEYSLPLTISSASVTRSFRNREFPAREIDNRSSSLSSQASAAPLSPSAKLNCCSKCLSGTLDGPESRKKSFTKVSFL